jgi:hypothetical protein
VTDAGLAGIVIDDIVGILRVLGWALLLGRCHARDVEISRILGAVGLVAVVGCSSSDPSLSAATTAATTPATSSSTSTTTTATTPTTVAVRSAIVSFDASDAVDGWVTVNDPVMGGQSTSEVAWRDAALVFSGELSLENNGGFASLVAPSDAVPAGAWVGRDGIRVAGSGDGKTYLLQLRAGGGSYVQRFVAGPTFSELLRFEDFVATSRFLDPLPDAAPLDPADIIGLAIYVLDKQVGPFELGLTAID